MTGVTYTSTSAYDVIKNDELCTDCIKLSSNPVKFSVTGFSNYTTNGSGGAIPEFSSSIMLMLGLLGVIGLFMYRRK
jgi:hypothetical protein